MSAVDPGSMLGMSMSDCFKTGLYSDLIIKDSNGHEYAVHRIIVCGQSTVFADACKPENGLKEAHTGVFDLGSYNPGAVKAMLEFMYRGTYTIRDSDTAMLETAHAYVIGHFYRVPEPKDFAVIEFKELSSTGWDTADFFAAVRVIYRSIQDTDNDGIRDIISSVIASHYDEMLSMAAFETVLDNFSALGKDVLRTLAKDKAGVPKSICRTYDCSGYSNAVFTHSVNLVLDDDEGYTKCPQCNCRRRNHDWALLVV